MLQTMVVFADQAAGDILLLKAKHILAEGTCGAESKWDFCCRLCPVNWTCKGPDNIPYEHLRQFLKHNEKLPISDDCLNTDVTDDINIMEDKECILKR